MRVGDRAQGRDRDLANGRKAPPIRVRGRELRLEAQTDAGARAEMSATMPPEYVEAFFRFYADGDLDESNVLATVRDLTGRRRRRFEQWAIAHADRFRAAAPAHASPQRKEQ